MADEAQTREPQKLFAGERVGQRVGNKSTQPNPTRWRPDVVTLKPGEPLLPQEQNFPNDTAHHV